MSRRLHSPPHIPNRAPRVNSRASAPALLIALLALLALVSACPAAPAPPSAPAPPAVNAPAPPPDRPNLSAAHRPRPGQRLPSLQLSTPNPDAPPLVLPIPSGTPDAAPARPLLVVLWATWCAPCIDELPALARLHRERGDRLRLVAVSIDDRGDRDAVAKAARDGGLPTNIVALDPDGRLPALLHLDSVPASALFDPEGDLLGLRLGAFNPDDPPLLKRHLPHLIPSPAAPR